MKRFCLLILSLVFCFLSMNAQKTNFKPQLYVGAGGSALFSIVDFVPSLTQKSHFGVSGGISAKYISEKHLGLLLELNIAQRGWIENYEKNPEYLYHRNLSYLEIPLMTHVYFGKKIRFVFNAGPQISFLINSSSSMSKDLSDFISKQPHQTPDPYLRYSNADRKFDYGLLGGLGMEFKTGIGDFDFEGRYYFGLGDLFKSTRNEEKGYYSRSAYRIIEAKLTYYFKLFNNK